VQLDQLQAERRQLLQLMQHATDQIMGLQDELRAALLSSSSLGRASRVSAANAAAAAASGAATGRPSSPDAANRAASPSGGSKQLSGAVVALAGHTGQLLAQTRQVAAAADAARQYQAAAASELQELREAYKELQQQHGKLQVRLCGVLEPVQPWMGCLSAHADTHILSCRRRQAEHLLLQKEQSELLARQVDATSQRNSLRQQCLVLEDAHAAAKQQVVVCWCGAAELQLQCGAQAGVTSPYTLQCCRWLTRWSCLLLACRWLSCRRRCSSVRTQQPQPLSAPAALQQKNMRQPWLR
jgi:hypothetical protein